MATKYRRTLSFLSAGKIHLKNSVKVAFMKEKVPQIQYKNPEIQIVSFKNTKTTPQVTVYHSNDTKTFIDCRYKKCEQILEELSITCAKPLFDKVAIPDSLFIKELESGNKPSYSSKSERTSKDSSQVEREAQLSLPNPANFGDVRKGQYCICRIPGQIPCPSITPVRNVDHSWKNKRGA